LEESVLIEPYSVEQASFPYSNQWHLTKATGINAEEAWNINKGRSDVIIAVCNGGVDYTHPNLDPGNRSRVITGYDFGDFDNDPIDNLPYNDPQSYAGHGTHISGIIGAFPTTTNPISGVMQNCKIMPVKMVRSGSMKIIFTNISLWDFSTTAFPSDVANAIDYAINNGARVINLSYGFSVTGFNTIDDIFLNVPLLYNKIKDAYSKNVVIVAAMGNEYEKGNPVEYPAAFYPVIAVGATTQSKAKASFSSTGPHICISAPGDNILSTIRGGSIGYKSGTSMAAPVVSGVAGLIISQGLDRNFNLTNDDVRHIMEITADKVGGADFTNETGYGIVNAHSALKLLSTPYQLFHEEAYGGNSSLFQSNIAWILSSNCADLPAGTYYGVDQYEVISHITFKNPFLDIPKVWIRDRECNVISFASPNNGLPKVSITNITLTGCDIRFAVYYVRYTAAGQTVNKWIPSTISSAKIAYTTVGIPAPAITGPSVVCPISTGTFTAENFPGNVLWSCSDNLSLSANGNTATVTNTGSTTGPTLITNTGYLLSPDSSGVVAASINIKNPPPPTIDSPITTGWVRAEVAGTSIAVDKTITTNSVDISSIDELAVNPPLNGENLRRSFKAQTSIPTNVDWSVTPPNGILLTELNDSDCLLEFTQEVTSFTITATTHNDCGSYSFSKTIGDPFCPTCPQLQSQPIEFSIAPNPTSAEVSIEVTDDSTGDNTSNATSATESTYTVSIVDMSGNKAFHGQKKGKKFNLSTSSLRNGIYTVIVTDGVRTGQGKLIVKH